MDFVLDNSVVMRWLLLDADGERQRYAEQVLASLGLGRAAAVPPLWWLELANVIARAERRKQLRQAQSHEFLQLLALQAIHESPQTGPALLERTLALARQYAVSSYDAAYLDLAMQHALPLATLDLPLRKVAAQVGVPLYVPEGT